MKSALVVAFTDLARDPRVLRQLRALRRSGVHVTTVGLAPPSEPVERHISVPAARGLPRRLLLAGVSTLRLDRLHHASRPEVRAARSALVGQCFDVVVANDLETLELCLQVAGPRTHVVFDAHEYAPCEFEDRWIWRVVHQGRLQRLCRRLLPRVGAMSTVSQGIADVYHREFGARASVVTNATAYQALEPSPVLDGRVRMIHHGVASPSRHPEEMIRLMQLLDERFSLDLMLIAHDPQYLAALKRLAAGNPRIRFRDPVPMPAIPAAINDYDVGLFLLPPVSVNNRHALPNKFFEFVQARLAVAIGPSPEMQRLVHEHGVGLVAEDFSAETMARALLALDATRLREFKEHSHRAAKELCAERNLEILRTLMRVA